MKGRVVEIADAVVVMEHREQFSTIVKKKKVLPGGRGQACCDDGIDFAAACRRRDLVGSLEDRVVEALEDVLADPCHVRPCVARSTRCLSF